MMTTHPILPTPQRILRDFLLSHTSVRKAVPQTDGSIVVVLEAAWIPATGDVFTETHTVRTLREARHLLGY